MKQNFDITGMGCAMCVKAVEKAVSALEGIKEVNVSLVENSMTAEYDEAVTDSEKIIAAVEAAGYGASLHSEEKTEEKAKKKHLFF